ncbi:MAG: hypothetical protein FJY54_14920 [Betaproteobacteria bacterium]|nr:hypothetical protein [Betaproteobacteria bacterium]
MTVRTRLRGGSEARGARPARDAALWLAAYLLIISAPLLLLLLGVHRAPGRGFVWDFSMALGYAALAMFGVQFVLTARFRRATVPFGIDIVYYFHRYLALCALAIVLLHVGLLMWERPQALGPSDPRRATAHMTAGRAALALLCAVALLALVRRRFALEYDRWRITHAAISVAAMALALWHVFAPVWTLVYLMIAVAGWRAWLARELAGARAAMAVYAVQLALNLGWSLLFFGGRMIGVAFAEILLLLGAVGVNVVLFWRIDRAAGWLLVPYAAWVAFASVLNLALWRLN